MTKLNEDAYKKIDELVKDIRIAMLTTLGPDGVLHSRPMATQEKTFEGTLWFLTREDSGKVFDIAQDSQVALTYVDGKHAFVSLNGRASVTRDRKKIEELWNPMYKAWFPEGKDDPEISVLRVDVDTAEYWEAPSNAILRNFQILKAAVTHGSSPVGEHDKVALN
ncbi:pyridoxamine 5'-phosphate oxidase family protein [Acidobacterium sp. S8]|uniref:pyridoxamine 5'-phosphate oxidase family protein n=1 Tax=Acidobacterium sp. S8 TaxID=1641854 RepID=UPI00131B211D|nr:pyridoxamine 5'-phosphate oxidase family protein [Acidobacterium sp. S8]